MKIDGKEYFWHTGTFNKAHAYAIKKLRKKKGNAVRIRTRKARWGPHKGRNIYDIYIR